MLQLGTGQSWRGSLRRSCPEGVNPVLAALTERALDGAACSFDRLLLDNSGKFLCAASTNDRTLSITPQVRASSLLATRFLIVSR